MDSIQHKKTLVEQVYDILLDAICSGELPAGERLNQDEIAIRLNVSRQPVNSAISILKAHDFVRDTGRRSVAVTDIRKDQYNSIYEFRAVVEPFAVQLASQRMPDGAGWAAEAIMREGREALQVGDTKRLLKADVRFHEMIYSWSGNHVIAASMRANWPHMMRAMAEILRDRTLAEQAWNDHQNILDALLSRNSDDAVAAMKTHIRNAMEKTVVFFKDRKPEK